MEEFLHAVKEIPKGLSSSNPHTFKKKVSQAVTQLSRLRQAAETHARDGHILMEGDLYLEPHPAALEANKKQKGPDAFPTHIQPLSEAGHTNDLLIHLGRASAFLELHPKASEARELNAEIQRALALFQKH